ncbi:hypothetical protein C5750_20030 [Phyllobacterium myrsinacearum]|uniref:Uncharacterized protein n=2 Tax=Phyllobacterium myrsinacearum TaxID=28101 RepID=A0A2S9JE14_9HYPH|nr:hypothetical protein C5750_20030 [Phyllobacterium myrsinacearum]
MYVNAWVKHGGRSPFETSAMPVFRLISNLWKVVQSADREARQLAALSCKPDEHLLRDAGVTRQDVAGIARYYRLKRLRAYLLRGNRRHR